MVRLPAGSGPADGDLVTLLVLGASRRNLERIAAAARQRNTVVKSRTSSPDWALVATSAQRDSVRRSSGLPACRVIHVQGLEADADLPEGIVEQGLTRMSELGPYTPVPGPRAVTLTGRLMPRILDWLERHLQEPPGTLTPKEQRMLEHRERKARANEDRRAERQSDGASLRKSPAGGSRE